MTSIANSLLLLTNEVSPSDSGPASLYTLYYHQRLKRYLITNAHEPTPDFIEKPGEESYKMFGGRRESAADVHEIGKADTTDELKQFVMAINSIVHFSGSIDDSVNFHTSLRNAFDRRFANLITDVH